LICIFFISSPFEIPNHIAFAEANLKLDNFLNDFVTSFFMNDLALRQPFRVG